MSKKRHAQNDTTTDDALRWLANIPSRDDVFRALTLFALANEPDGRLHEDVLVQLHEFVDSDLMLTFGMAENIVRGNFRVGLKDGELSFSLTDKGRKEAERVVLEAQSEGGAA